MCPYLDLLRSLMEELNPYLFLARKLMQGEADSYSSRSLKVNGGMIVFGIFQKASRGRSLTPIRIWFWLEGWRDQARLWCP